MTWGLEDIQESVWGDEKQRDPDDIQAKVIIRHTGAHSQLTWGLEDTKANVCIGGGERVSVFMPYIRVLGTLNGSQGEVGYCGCDGSCGPPLVRTVGRAGIRSGGNHFLHVKGFLPLPYYQHARGWLARQRAT